MNERFFAELSAWLIQAGLAGTSETGILSVICDRCVAARIPLGARQYLSTRSIRFTRADYSVGALVQTEYRVVE